MNEQDVRVIKSKKAIRDALFSILASKPINKITIKEISETAGINRKTFYTHYDSIEDIITEMENELVVSIDSYLKNCIIAEYGLNPYYFIQFINAIYSSNPEFCESLVSVHNYHFLAEKIKKVFKKQLINSIDIPDKDKQILDFKAKAVQRVTRYTSFCFLKLSIAKSMSSNTFPITNSRESLGLLKASVSALPIT